MEYNNEAEILESFLQKKPCSPEIPLSTDGNKLMSYGIMVARWDGDKMCLMSDRVENAVVKGINYARAIRRILRNITGIAKARKLI